MIFSIEKKYFFPLNPFKWGPSQEDMILVLMPQIRLSNNAEKKAIKFYKIVTTFK